MRNIIDPDLDAAIRADERVKRDELQFRDEASATDDPIEFSFTPRGRHLLARLAQSRVVAAIEIRKRGWDCEVLDI